MDLVGSTAPSFGHRERPGFTVDAEVLTWDLAVFRVAARTGGASFVACVPGDEAKAWLARLDAGELDAELAAVVARPPRRALRRIPRSVSRANARRPGRVGVEHEYEVLVGGRAVDFRTVLRAGGSTPAAGAGAPAADPVDPHARRHPWGVVTADGREAEIAIDAEPWRPGFAHRAVGATDVGRRQLEAMLADGSSLRGYSTHLSVSWSPRDDRRQARRWAAAFAPGLMLLLDDRSSPGLLVRPRPGRLELCGDFADGDRLAAAVVYAVGSVRALDLDRRAVDEHRLAVRLDPAVERFGWFVDRSAFGPDLYAAGRDAQLVGGVGRGAHGRRAPAPAAAARAARARWHRR